MESRSEFASPEVFGSVPSLPHPMANPTSDRANAFNIPLRILLVRKGSLFLPDDLHRVWLSSTGFISDISRVTGMGI
ncbi:MAG: hypothetical protein VYB72_04805, partial [Planctomycetota bacterium]|nr:hypothetical protein [Planctomycetota bacterium]